MEYLKVSKEFVLQAYTAACAEWKKKILAQFPTLCAPITKQQIESMPSYTKFFEKSYGNPLEFTDSKVHVKITNHNSECLFAAWNFVETFTKLYPGHNVTMGTDRIILTL